MSSRYNKRKEIPDISIIITVYNQANCFYKALRSVQNQIVENPQINDDVPRITSLDQNTLKQIKEDKTTNSYSMCKCCGFFYFSSRANTRGKHNCFIKFLQLSDIFGLLGKIKSFLHMASFNSKFDSEKKGVIP